MTSDDFKAWRFQMGLKRGEAARALGLNRNQPARYEKDGTTIPLYVALACTALLHGIAPWTQKNDC